jgi:hypothetical protein
MSLGLRFWSLMKKKGCSVLESHILGVIPDSRTILRRMWVRFQFNFRFSCFLSTLAFRILMWSSRLSRIRLPSRVGYFMVRVRECGETIVMYLVLLKVPVTLTVKGPMETAFFKAVSPRAFGMGEVPGAKSGKDTGWLSMSIVVDTDYFIFSL